jgi:raffinose/stachyose/melibiose transport system permease protein
MAGARGLRAHDRATKGGDSQMAIQAAESPDRITSPESGRSSRAGRKRPNTRRGLTLAALVVPAFGLFGLFVVWPLVSSVRYSFYNWSGTGPLTNFIGFKNYTYTLFSHDFAPQFWRAIWHNVYFFIISMVLTLIVGLLLAYLMLLVNERATRRYSVIFILPFMLPPVVVAFMWSIYLEPNIGVLNSMADTLHMSWLYQPFLGDPSLALPTIAVLTAWIGMGFPVLVFLAAMSDVPKDMLDAAALDGAGRIRILFNVLIPSIRPTLVVITSMNFIGAFSTFDLIYIMEGSQAGPNYSTDVLSTLFYRTGFGGFGSTAQSMGLATALAVIGFLMVVGVSGGFLWLQKRAAV